MRTLAEPVSGEFVRVEPADEPGVRVNGIPADLDHTQKADVRVDLYDERTRAFVVEHVLGPLRLCGVTAADVVGTVETWAFARPEHRFCYSTDLGPDAVVSHPAGLPNPALADAVCEGDVRTPTEETRRSVREPVSYAANGGEITVSPRDHGTGVTLELRFEDAQFACEVPPEGAAGETIEAVTNATTPYLAPSPEEGVVHAVADVLSDVVVIGGLDDVHIEAELAAAYHALTIGVARRAAEEELVVERTGGVP